MLCWQKAEQSTDLDLTALVKNNTESITPYLNAVRYFLLADSSHQEFYHEYLQDRVAYTLERGGLISDDELNKLSLADQALLVYAGISRLIPDEKMIRFVDPVLDVIDCRISPLDSTSYIIECYLVSRQVIATNLTFSVRLHYKDTTRPEFSSTLQFAQVDILLENSSTRWVNDEVKVGIAAIRCYSQPVSVSVAVTNEGITPAAFLKAEDFEGHFIHLNSSVLSGL